MGIVTMNEKGKVDEKIVQLLLNLQDEDYSIREQANRELKKLGMNAESILVEALKDTNEKIRLGAAIALGIEIGKTVFTYNYLLEYKGEKAAQNMLNKLIEIEEEVVPVLAIALNDINAEIRKEAAHALGEARERAEKATPMLIEAMKDKDQEVRYEVVQALSSASEEDYDKVIPVLKEALRDDFWQVRSSAVITLGAMGEEAAETVPEIIEIIKNDDELRWDAADALASIGKPAVSFLIDLLQGEWTNGHWAAAETLVKIGEQVEYAVPILIIALNSNNPDTLWQTKDLLRKIGEQGIPKYIELLNEGDENIRKNTVKTLGELGKLAQLALPELERQLLKEKNNQMKFTLGINMIRIERKRGIGTKTIDNLEKEGVLDNSQREEYTRLCENLKL